MLLNDLQWTLLVFAPILIYWCENPGYITASTDTVWCVSYIFKYISDLAILAIHYLVHLRNMFLRMVRFTMQTTLSLSSVFLYILFFMMSLVSYIFVCFLVLFTPFVSISLFAFPSFVLSFSFSSTFCLVGHLLLILLLFQCLFQFIYFFHLDVFFVLTLISIPNSSDIIIFWQKVMTQLFFFIIVCLLIVLCFCPHYCSGYCGTLILHTAFYLICARFHQQPYIWCCYWELKYPLQNFSLFSVKFFNLLFRDLCPCFQAISECCLQECLK